MGKIKNYYAGGNTYLGFYSLYENIFRDLDSLYIFKGGPGTGKSSFMREIGTKMADLGFDVHYYHCSSDNQSLDGVIMPAISLGFVDGTAPHIVDPKYPGAVDKIINLADFWNEEALKANKSNIIRLTNDISNSFKAAYEQFEEAKQIHDEWEDIYLSGIDFEKANQVTDDLISQIFVREHKYKETKPTTRKVFFGAATPNGAVNYIDNITEDLDKRYIVKGRPGSGKSTMMKKLGKEAEEQGLSVEYFPCGFDPNSLDMIIIPALSVAVIDGTAPHIIDAERETDEIVDMYKLCIDEQVEITQEKEIENIALKYKIKMTIGTNYIKDAKRLHDLLENHYVKAMDFSAVNKIREEIFEEILPLAKSKK